MFETFITSKTRIRILVHFFINVATNFNLRGLEGEMNESTNSIRKGLNNLTETGYLEKKASQNSVSYKANIKHLLYKTLKEIIFKHLGLDIIIAVILSRMGDVKQIVFC